MAKIIEKRTTITREIELTPAVAGEAVSTRVLTVREGREGHGSQILLSGQWLKDAGFEPRDRVAVTVAHNRLVVEKLEEK